jgi:hypothetical protein
MLTDDDIEMLFELRDRYQKFNRRKVFGDC